MSPGTIGLLAAAVYANNEKAAEEKQPAKFSGTWLRASSVRTVWPATRKPLMLWRRLFRPRHNAAYSDLSRVFLHDVATGNDVGELAGMKGNEELAFTPDGKKLLTGGFSSLFGLGYDRNIRVWDLATRKALGQWLLRTCA